MLAGMVRLSHACAGCGDTHSTGLHRRGFLGLVGAAAAALTVRPARAGGPTEALLLTCMDYRLRDDVERYMTARGLRDNYDEIILAGAGLAPVSDTFSKWHPVFFDHVDLAIKLHHVKRLIVLDHRDCGAYKLVFGAVASRDAETALHAQQLRTLAGTVRQRYPDLGVELGLMDLDGSVEILADA